MVILKPFMDRDDFKLLGIVAGIIGVAAVATAISSNKKKRIRGTPRVSASSSSSRTYDFSSTQTRHSFNSDTSFFSSSPTYNDFLEKIEGYVRKCDESEERFSSIEEAVKNEVYSYSCLDIGKSKYEIQNIVNELNKLRFNMSLNLNFSRNDLKDFKELIREAKHCVDDIYFYSRFDSAIRRLEEAIRKKEDDIFLIENINYGGKSTYTCFKCWRSFEGGIYSDKCPDCLNEEIDKIKYYIEFISDFDDFVRNLKNMSDSI